MLSTSGLFVDLDHCPQLTFKESEDDEENSPGHGGYERCCSLDPH